MKFVFFGTSSHSCDFLELLKGQGVLPELIVTKAPRPVGRKRILTQNPCEIFAKENGIPFVTNHIGLIRHICHIGIILDYARMIPPNIISLFSKGIINIHFSKLPQFRGASPVQYTILTKQKSAWITWYLIDKDLDTGPILWQEEYPLKGTETTGELYRLLCSEAAKLSKKVVQEYLGGGLAPRPQSEPEPEDIPAPRLTTEQCKINWRQPAPDIDALIRASHPEPGAWTTVEINGQPKRLKLLKSRMENGKLILEEVQMEGKRPVGWKQFKDAYPVVVHLGAQIVEQAPPLHSDCF